MHKVENDFLDLLGQDAATFEKVELNDLLDTITYLGAKYQQLLVDTLAEKDAASSGDLSDSIKALEVRVNGKVYTVDIEAKDYAKFVDNGVDGWARSRGSIYKFKTKGVLPNSPHVKAMKKYLEREQKSSTDKYSITKRERKGKQIIDFKTRTAMRAAYMVKRFGIPATHFWTEATAEMERIVEDELGVALKVDIINNLTK